MLSKRRAIRSVGGMSRAGVACSTDHAARSSSIRCVHFHGHGRGNQSSFASSSAYRSYSPARTSCDARAARVPHGALRQVLAEWRRCSGRRRAGRGRRGRRAPAPCRGRTGRSGTGVSTARMRAPAGSTPRRWQRQMVYWMTKRSELLQVMRLSRESNSSPPKQSMRWRESMVAAGSTGRARMSTWLGPWLPKLFMDATTDSFVLPTSSSSKARKRYRGTGLKWSLGRWPEGWWKRIGPLGELTLLGSRTGSSLLCAVSISQGRADRGSCQVAACHAGPGNSTSPGISRECPCCDWC